MKQKLFVAATIVLMMAFTPAMVNGKAKKEIALQLYSLKGIIGNDYDNVIKNVAKMGYTGIEAASYNNGKFYGKTPEEFKASIENAGMQVLSSHASKGLSEKELESKDFTEALKWWDQCIAAHKAAGMTYLVSPGMDAPKTLAGMQTLCEYLNVIGKKCKENGLLFGYHNHSYEFYKEYEITGKEDKIMMLNYMLENTNPEYVFFEMDVYWVVRGQQSPVDYFHKYPGRFTVLHIKDNKEIGQSGMVGFDAIFNNTDIAGVKHLVVEVERYNFEPEVSVKKSLDYLNKAPYVKKTYSK